MGTFGQNAAERSEGDDAGDALVGVSEWIRRPRISKVLQ